jgi:hypothetical protein
MPPPFLKSSLFHGTCPSSIEQKQHRQNKPIAISFHASTIPKGSCCMRRDFDVWHSVLKQKQKNAAIVFRDILSMSSRN